jgi:hypothetical protein
MTLRQRVGGLVRLGSRYPRTCGAVETKALVSVEALEINRTKTQRHITEYKTV